MHTLTAITSSTTTPILSSNLPPPTVPVPDLLPPPPPPPPPPPVHQKPSQSELEGFRGVTFIAKKEVAAEGGWFPLT